MRIVTSSRLHFGFIDPFGDMGRIYGSIGVAIERPCWIVEVDPYSSFSVETKSKEVKNKIINIAEKIKKHYKKELNIKIKIISDVPLHQGLGAGTQLSLAVSEGILKSLHLLYGKDDIIRFSGRGERSGIGIMAYFSGGFNLDAGKSLKTPSVPLPLFHVDFPDEWLFLLVLPSIEVKVHGDDEKTKFSLLKKINTKEISHIVLMGLLPSLIDNDIEGFGKSLTMIQEKVGEMFSVSQGGIFAHSICKKIIEFMLRNGVFGAGQSSWGPIIYGLVKKGKTSCNIEKKVNEYISFNGIKGKTWLVRANNNGRTIILGEHNADN